MRGQLTRRLPSLTRHFPGFAPWWLDDMTLGEAWEYLQTLNWLEARAREEARRGERHPEDWR